MNSNFHQNLKEQLNVISSNLWSTGICNIPYIGHVKCYEDFDIFNEDDKDYCIGWKEPPCFLEDTLKHDSYTAWKYKSGRLLHTRCISIFLEFCFVSQKVPYDRM